MAYPADSRTLQLLESIPGVGQLTARTLLAEIETIFRFEHPEKLISYAGLAPKVRQSAGNGSTRSSDQEWLGLFTYGAD
jgi:transposase